VFANGIWALSLMSAALLIAVRGNTNALIPMFAIGVFTGFTLSQTGLVVHWRRTRPPRWRQRAAINGLGAVVTGVSTVIFLVTKFLAGAWVVVIAVPLFILLFHRIESYYKRVASELGLGTIPPRPRARRTTVVVAVSNVSRLTSRALTEALSIGQEVIAVTVVFASATDADSEGTAADAIPAAPSGHSNFQAEWEQWHPGVSLVVLRTEYSSVSRPIVDFVDELRADRDDQIVVLIPVTVPARFRHRALHNQLDFVLSQALRGRDDIVVARVPMLVDAFAGTGAECESLE
jgi:hypothetical protein